MLSVFDNETENGKLYISYPMIESIKHFSCYELCYEKDLCFYPIEDSALYKKYVSDNCMLTDLRYINKEQWYFIIQKFITTIMCLFNNCLLSKSLYNELVTPMTIFEYQEKLYIIPNNHVMILSGFTEFLLDYFKIDILEDYIGHQLFNDLYITNNCLKLYVYC
ncbi:MAG: hypothetical protein LUG12_07140 [Erysipelotrichaceae bacterium]|nr:hypothetical protein [Erysipelotrichaceae bacterium]